METKLVKALTANLIRNNDPQSLTIGVTTKKHSDPRKPRLFNVDPQGGLDQLKRIKTQYGYRDKATGRFTKAPKQFKHLIKVFDLNADDGNGGWRSLNVENIVYIELNGKVIYKV